MTLVTELQYFPPVIAYKNVDQYSNILFEQYEKYPKMGFRNRCQVAGAAGIINLSIPLDKGRDQRGLMKDVKISPVYSWQVQHWKTIQSCYNRSPWFEFYRDDLECLYSKSVDFLVDWNLACFEWTLQTLHLAIDSSLSTEFRKEYDPGGWTDRRNGRAPVSLRSYRQVFEDRIGFIPNLSIVDLLFCEGREAVKYIRS
jgi:hypothetical protein